MVTRIVLNPDQLSETASVLENACGEYEAIGSRVYSCDCGCMPADVAGLVDGVTAEVRSGLQGISLELGAQASELAERAGVPQEDSFTAVGAAWGGAAIEEGQTVEIGSGFDTSGLGDGQTVAIGSGLGSWGFSDGQTVEIGSGFDTSGLGDGQTVAIGSGFDTSGVGDGETVTIETGFDPSGFGFGNGTASTADAIAALTALAAQSGDPEAQMLIAAIAQRIQLTATTWAQPPSDG